MLSMISRSRKVPTSRTSWPLSESGKASAVPIMPEPRILTVVTALPPNSQNLTRCLSSDQTPFATSPRPFGGVQSLGTRRVRLHATTRDVPDSSVHQLAHLRICFDVPVHIEAIRLMSFRIRLNGAQGVNHVLSSGLYVGVDTRTYRGQHRRPQHGAFALAREGDRHVRHVSVHLHPQFALGRTTSNDGLRGLEAVLAHGPEDVLRAVADALHDRSEDVAGTVAQRDTTSCRAPEGQCRGCGCPGSSRGSPAHRSLRAPRGPSRLALRRGPRPVFSPPQQRWKRSGS